jgi:hypothetical protein
METMPPVDWSTVESLCRKSAQCEAEVVALLTPLVLTNPQARLAWLESQPFARAGGWGIPLGVLARLRQAFTQPGA